MEFSYGTIAPGVTLPDNDRIYGRVHAVSPQGANNNLFSLSKIAFLITTPICMIGMMLFWTVPRAVQDLYTTNDKTLEANLLRQPLLLASSMQHARHHSHEDPSKESDSTTTDLVILNGFENNIQSKENPSGQLHWYCAPDSWKNIPFDKREGRDGSWSLTTTTTTATTHGEDSKMLVLTPPAKKDYWRKTFYEPVLIKDDAPFLYASLKRTTTTMDGPKQDQFYTMETSFVLTAVRQFDQAGLMIRISPEYWLKTGIEVVDHHPRLSCVVTNHGYSDWSTQSWSNYMLETTTSTAPMITNNDAMQQEQMVAVVVPCQIRIHIRGSSFVVEAKMPESNNTQWQFIRIAHLGHPSGGHYEKVDEDGTLRDDSPTGRDELWAGIFAASPEDQQGGHAIFSKFEIRQGSHFEHNANGNGEDTS